MTTPSVIVPDDVRESIRGALWAAAEAVGWSGLSAADKTRHYEHWTQDPKIGGILTRYMDLPRVRVYLKDAVFKPYSRARLADWSRCARAVGVEGETSLESFIKPHGRRLRDGRVVCWGPASSWKVILMALHERTYGDGSMRPFAAVLFGAVGRYREERVRQLVHDAAAKLLVARVVWLES
jgi:hypothetical protein